MTAVPDVGVYRPVQRERERGVSRGGVSEERWSTSEYGDGGGLASSIVTQESSDLTLIHVQIQTIHCNLSLFLFLFQKTLHSW